MTHMIRSKQSPSTALAVILGCSALLVILTQLIEPHPDMVTRTPISLLMIMGLLLFGGALLAARNQTVAEKLTSMLGRSLAYFSITGWQMALLLFALPFAWLARIASGNGLLAYDAFAANSAWLLACTFVIIGAWHIAEPKLSLAWSEIGLIILIFVAAFALRWINITTIPTTLSGDEASAAFSSLAFLDGQLTNWFAKGWFSFPSLFYRVNSIGLVLFGRTIEGVRFLATVAGALTVVGVYVVGRVVFGRITGLIAAILLAGQHFHIHFSRIGLQNVWDGMFAMVALSGLWVGWRYGRRSGYIVCGVALGLGQYFYVTFRAMPIIVLVWVLIVAVRQRDRFKQQLPSLMLAAWIALMIFLPLGLYFLDQPQEFNAPLQRVTVLEGWLTQKAAEQGTSEAAILLNQMWISAQGITHLPLQHWYTVGQPLLLPIASAIFLLGLIWLLIAFDSRSLLILLPMLAIIVAGGLSRDAPASQRYVMVAPLTVLVIAAPLAQIPSLIESQRTKQIVLTISIAIALVLSTVSARFYFTDVFDSYVLGGFNTETAMELVDYLSDQPAQTIGFVGWPQMNYGSIQTLPFLVPHIDAVNLIEPLTAPPDEAELYDTYIFLPGRVPELAFIQQANPNGQIFKSNRGGDAQLYFIAYQLKGETK